MKRIARLAVTALACASLLLAVSACTDSQEPTSPRGEELGQIQQSVVRRPYHWSVHDFPSSGTLGQLQSVYPLDATGDLVLVGGVSRDYSYMVYDLSSGSPVLVTSVGDLWGWKVAAHSPHNSSVGFGGSGNVLVKYDGSFQLIPMPCGADEECMINGVWASSPIGVWITRSRRSYTEGIWVHEIWHWNGEEFSLEYQGEPMMRVYYLFDIWGFLGSQTMYAVGDRILQRNADGVWQEVVGREQLPPNCRGLFKVRGIRVSDVWASALDQCILHYDGETWSKMATPAGVRYAGAIWPLDARQILLAGYGDTDITVGRISIWGSVDRGESWTQLQDPVFTQLPVGGQYASFFAIAGTLKGTRVYAPIMRGGRLVIGSLTPMQSHVSNSATSGVSESADSEGLILPEVH